MISFPKPLCQLLLSVLCILGTTLGAHAQLNIALSLPEPELDRKLLKRQNIKALYVFETIVDMELGSQQSLVSGKARELEFDDQGNTIYAVNLYGALSSIAQSSGPVSFTLFKYDQNNQEISKYSEGIKSYETELTAYDKKGNIELKTYYEQGSFLCETANTWEKGTIVLQKTRTQNGIPDNRIREFDCKGRVILVQNGDNKTILKYKDHGDKTIIKTTRLAGDTIQSSSTYITSTEFDKNLFTQTRDAKGNTLSETKATYDKYGNITSYSFFSNYSNKPDSLTTPPCTLRIVNQYSKRELLTKRTVYLSTEDISNDILLQIRHYIYDTDPLQSKLPKGSVNIELRLKKME